MEKARYAVFEALNPFFEIAGGTAFGFEFSGGRHFAIFRRVGGFGCFLGLLTSQLTGSMRINPCLRFE